MDTRIRILKTAGMLFSKLGIRAITMDTIAQELGISKRTIYEFFTDKDTLLEQAIIEGLKLHKEQILSQIDEADNVIYAIINFVRSHHKIMSKINPLFFVDLQKYHPIVFKRINEKGELRDYRISKTLLEKGVKDGTFINDLNIELSNKFFHAVMDFCKPDGDIGEKYQIKDIAHTIFLPYLRGICTPKGLKLLDDTEFYKNIDL